MFNFERGSAPPISLSSPELGAESEGFEEHIRNSYSSSELLYERNLNRFNGYSNDEHASSEALKIAIYAMDRKNSLRRSPITRTSNDGSEGKSIFSDSDSVHSVVDVTKRANTNSFLSLANSIEEEAAEGVEVEEMSDDDRKMRSSSVPSPVSRKSYVESDSDSSSNGGEFVQKFGSGKRALEPNASSAFFSTVYYDDDYLSDQRLSDRERSASPRSVIDSSAVPTASAVDRSDAISRDSLNTSGSDVSSGEYSRPSSPVVKNVGNDTEDKITVVESSTPVITEDRLQFRPRDGIPKYVMLPNPFYRENADRVKFELSSNSTDEIVPPEIPERDDGDGNDASPGRLALPVITVTETNDRSPKSVLKKIFVPALSGFDEKSSRQQQPQQQKLETSSSYYDKYNNVNSSAFDTLKRSPERGQAAKVRDASDEEEPAEDVPAEMVVVRHYGDIVERYSGAAKKTASRTYLDFDELKMAASVESEPDVDASDRHQSAGDEEWDDYYDDYDANEFPQENGVYRGGQGELAENARSELEFRPSPTPASREGGEEISETDASVPSDDRQLTVALLQTDSTTSPNLIPYLKIFGNLSLALFGYWLYACKDEKLSVPVFGFLLFRFFKTQVWDRI